MKKEVYGLVTFESTSHAIKGEKIFKEMDISIKIIPTLREITASCGLSIRFHLEDLEKIKKGIEEYDLAIKGIYKFYKESGKYNVEKIM